MNAEGETGRPLIVWPAFVVIKPVSPVSLKIVSDDTAASRLEEVSYVGGQAVHPLVIRERNSMTA